MIILYNSSPERGINLENVVREGNSKILCTVYSDAIWESVVAAAGDRKCKFFLL
jgi:hypothetical protein